MRALRSHEIDELEALARRFCSVLAACRTAKVEGRLSPEQELMQLLELAKLDEKIERLKHPSAGDVQNNEILHGQFPDRPTGNRRLRSA